jgi:NADH:ubiquinone oxidoreductase subunit H
MSQLFSYFAVAYLTLAYLLLFFSIVTLFFERKFIAIAQKRLGISFLGRNGWIHLPADMVKFWFKYSGRHTGNWLTNTNSTLIVLIGFFCWNVLSCLFFLADGGNVFFDFWDYQFLVYFGYANLTTAYMFNIVVSVKSKYATVASIRILLVSIFLEVFFALCFLFIYIHTGGYSFDEISSSNTTNWLLFAIPPVALFFGIYAIFEAKRAPFDHTEAESELVSGHLIEFGGRLLLFFYFSEYIHAYFCMFLILVIILGGVDVFSYFAVLPYFLDSLYMFDIYIL